ncbi:MAG TPA: SpoIIE family protein phosphatase [Candidatus Angelobacter sp.]
MFSSVCVPLTDLSSVGEARRAGLRLSAALGFSEVKSGELGIIITEAARNAVVHAGSGQMVMSAFSYDHERRMDVLALDKGHGIQDLSRAMQDGFSTAGTPGSGLGAIQRLASRLDLFSTSQGTALLAQVIESGSPSAKQGPALGGIAVPVLGETLCGDGLAWSQKGDVMKVILVDGLGHGIDAAAAADEAKKTFHQYSQYGPAEIMARVHDALKKTRGAAAAIAEVRPLAGRLTYVGIGNISGSVLSDGRCRNLVSHNGTLGHVMARLQEFTVEWPNDAILIMHSDGIQSRWDLMQYPGLMARSPASIAGILFRDFRRQRDDSSVVVVKGQN